MPKRKYTEEHINFLKENVSGRSYVELTEMFNKHFGTNYPVSTVMSTSFRYGFKNGRDTTRKKGYEPTQFKKGNKPANYRPLGSELIDKDGYLRVKTEAPSVWKMKHVLVWEQAHGKVPKGHVVIFGDGDKSNVNLSNLILVTRAELAIINKHKLILNDADLTRTGVSIAAIYLKISGRKKTLKKRDERG